jgi:hypothetical protein
VVACFGSEIYTVILATNIHNDIRGKGEERFHPRTGHESPEGEYRNSSTLSLTSALDGVGGQRHAPASLHPRKNQKEAGWAPGLVWTGAENLASYRDSIAGPSSS